MQHSSRDLGPSQGGNMPCEYGVCAGGRARRRQPARKRFAGTDRVLHRPSLLVIGLGFLVSASLLGACKQPQATCQRVKALYEKAHNPGPFRIEACEAGIRDLSWSEALCVQGCSAEETHDKFAACRPRCFVKWGQAIP